MQRIIRGFLGRCELKRVLQRWEVYHCASRIITKMFRNFLGQKRRHLYVAEQLQFLKYCGVVAERFQVMLILIAMPLSSFNSLN